MFGIRRPIVSSDAWRYVLIMVVSFAISVVTTRLYLEAAGYPQIGNATFHFAHALWGGLLQVGAALLLLTFTNRWVYSLSAALAGIGIGLFVDEVGKFITQNNDYFFPLGTGIKQVRHLEWFYNSINVRIYSVERSLSVEQGASAPCLPTGSLAYAAFI
jgi:hypothetical protein